MKVIVQAFKKDGVRVNDRLILNISDESYIGDNAADIEDFLNQQFFELKEEEEDE